MSININAINPSTVWQVPETFRSVYTHATEVSSASKVLFISGQFGVRPDGSLPEAFPEQAEQAMQNIEAILAVSGMSFSNVAKLNFLLTRSTDAPDLVKIRSSKWGKSQPPAVTVVTVSALAKPEYLIEIEATAFA
jgi:enamine deaminase RidA (YjgF/YER057c/UK114 family)